VFRYTGGAVKQIIHDLQPEALPRCLELVLRLPQHVSRLRFICIAICAMLIIQTRSYKTLSPCAIKVVAFDMDDEVVQYDAHASPHDDNLVSFGIDDLDLDFLQGLKGPLQQAHRVLNLYMYL
jgi:hypothetical protein